MNGRFILPLLLALPLLSQTRESRRPADRRIQISAAGASGGSCSAALPDGRSFITGGAEPLGPLATAEYFETDASVTSAAPMLTPRTNHVCVALEDGTVLVAGGDPGKDGPTNAAEIFHPDTNSWTPTGPILTLRQKAAAVLLKNGKALIIGGEVSGAAANTMEVYDPVAGVFTQAAGVLSPPRTGHAVALLDDGRVIIAGGFEGKRVLDSIDIFDPEQGVFSGGRLSSPRANFTATTLAGGKVLIAGGTDGSHELPSAELYDPATGDVLPAGSLAAPRQKHLAIRPAGREQVLIAGGTARNRTVSLAELFNPSENTFRSASEAANERSAGLSITTWNARSGRNDPFPENLRFGEVTLSARNFVESLLRAAVCWLQRECVAEEPFSLCVITHTGGKKSAVKGIVGGIVRKPGHIC